MPRLVLLEDDGSELFSGAVSRENVEILGRFIKRNLPAFRAAAAYKRALDAAGELFGAIAGDATPARAPRKGSTRVIYDPPRRRRA